jgi:hypothetical protein
VPRVRVLFACLALLACAAPAAHAFPHGNPANRLLARPLDPERYDFARRCRKHPTKGALALQAWLERNVRGVSWGIMRCEKLSRRNYSLHSEGRALDWHLDAHDRTDRRVARKLIALLLAPDRLGNGHALARRMGIQGIIWNCRSWFSGARGMGRYSVCDRKHVSDTLAHRDHVHLELNLPGARMQTSFWRRRVASGL